MSDVILVSSDRELREGLKGVLRETPARITMEFAGMKPALEGFPKEGAKMVVIDYFVPDGTGLELLKTLRPADEECLFVLLLRVRTRSAMEKALRYGAHDVLEYPVSLETIRDTLLRRLAAKQDEDAAEEVHRKA